MTTDIYIPDLMLAFEYQGAQHYQPTSIIAPLHYKQHAIH